MRPVSQAMTQTAKPPSDRATPTKPVEVQPQPYYALNNKFKELDATPQYLLYCDKGVMSRLHAHHLLSEGHANVRVYRPT